MNSMNQMFAMVGGVVIVVAGLTGCEEKKPAAAVSEAEALPVVEDAGPIYLRLHSELDPALVKKVAEFDGSVDGQLSGMLGGASGVIQQAIAASKMPNCDFGERNTSLNSRRPGLTPSRTIARLLRADAKRCLDAGDADGAAERAASVLRLSRQVAGGAESTIDVSVACALMKLGAQMMTDLAGQNISAAAKEELRAAAQKGSFANVESKLAAEYRMMATEMRTNPKFAKDWEELSGDSSNLSPAELEKAAAALEQFAGAFPGLWNGPDSEGQLGLASSKLPGLAAKLTWTASKIRGGVNESEQQMAMARAGIR